MSIATLGRKDKNGARYAQYHKMEKANTLNNRNRKELRT